MVAGQKICTKWAVFTTIFAPSVATRQMASLADWCTVIVADKKPPPGLQNFEKGGTIFRPQKKVRELIL